MGVRAIVFNECSVNDLVAIEADAAEWILDHSSQAIRVGAASATYNCHNYAWHSSDGGRRVWINQTAYPNLPNVSRYWSGTSPTYLSTSSSHASKVFYPNGDHSAIVLSPTLFESKWGAWPKYQHAPSDCPYTSTNLQYFYIPLDGNTHICSSEPYTTTQFLNAEYSWTGQGINIIPNGSSATGSVNTHGSGWIQASISTEQSGTTVKTEKRTLSLGILAAFNGSSSIAYLGSGSWTATATCGISPYTYEWYLRKGGTGLGAYYVASGNTLTLISVRPGMNILDNMANQGTIAKMQPPVSTSFFLSLRAIDANGNIYRTQEFPFYAYGNVDLIPQETPLLIAQTNYESENIEVFPNPTSSLLSVNINSSLARADQCVEITLLNKSMKKQIHIKSKSLNNLINVTQLTPDVYFLQIDYNGKRIVRQIAIQ